MTWNPLNRTAEGIVMVAVGNEIRFFRVSKDLKIVNEFWNINLNKNIIHFEYFKLNKMHELVFITESGSSDKSYSADIYNFDHETKTFYLLQYIILKYPCYDVTVLESNMDYIISFPQNNTVENYIYRGRNADKNYFEKFNSIDSMGVQTVSSFSMGGYHYLAVGGSDAQILRYHHGILEPQTVLSSSFGFVEQWLPIPARSHRDDLLLLVQHRVNYVTHFLSVLETLIWDGESFNTVPYTPCRKGKYRNNLGISCMLDPDRESGIAGAAIVQQGK